MARSERRSMTWRTFYQNCAYCGRVVRPNTRGFQCSYACDGVRVECTQQLCPRWRRLPIVTEKFHAES